MGFRRILRWLVPDIHELTQLVNLHRKDMRQCQSSSGHCCRVPKQTYSNLEVFAEGPKVR
jgi:hypothetical protein